MALGNPVTIRFEPDELDALKEKAREDRRPVGFVVREAVRAFCLGESGRDAASIGSDTADRLLPSRQTQDEGAEEGAGGGGHVGMPPALGASA